MKVIKRVHGYTQDPTRYFNFERFEKKCGNLVLIEAGFEEKTNWKEYNLTAEKLDKILKRKIVRIDVAEPTNFFTGDNPDHYDHQFHKIFTICPYTAKWLNKRQHNNKRIPIFFPFNEELIPKRYKKKYDIIYTGHILAQAIDQYINTMSMFNYKVVSNSKHPLVTNRSAPYAEKMKLIAESKITLVANLLYLRYDHLFFVWKTPNYKGNEAFKLVPKWYEIHKWFNKEVLVPQVKSRLFEAAFGRSLILCRRDPFNIVERFFEPGKEFVYFENENLGETIRYILDNYQSYEKVIERAYRRAISSYTTKKFVEKYLMKIKP